MTSPATSGFIRPIHSQLQALSRLLDISLIIGTLYLSLIAYGVNPDKEYLIPCFIATALFGLFAENNEIYQGWRGDPLFDESLRIMAAWIGSFTLLLTGIYLYNPDYSYSFEVIQLWLPLAPTSIIILHSLRRTCLSYLRQQGFNTRSCAIYGANSLGLRLRHAILDLPWLGYQFIGFYDDRAEAEERRLNTKDIGPLAGDFKELLQLAQQGIVDHIYITLPLGAENRISDYIEQLADSTASVNIVPDFFTFNLIQSKWSNIQGIPVVSVFDTPFGALDGAIKRLEDIILCLIILPLIALPMLIISIAIKLTDSINISFIAYPYRVIYNHP